MAEEIAEAADGSKSFTLTPDQLRYLQACYNDSTEEGHFSPLFEAINADAVENQLIAKGVLLDFYGKANRALVDNCFPKQS